MNADDFVTISRKEYQDLLSAKRALAHEQRRHAKLRLSIGNGGTSPIASGRTPVPPKGGSGVPATGGAQPALEHQQRKETR